MIAYQINYEYEGDEYICFVRPVEDPMLRIMSITNAGGKILNVFDMNYDRKEEKK